MTESDHTAAHPAPSGPVQPERPRYAKALPSPIRRMLFGYDLGDFWQTRRACTRSRSRVAKVLALLRYRRICDHFTCSVPLAAVIPESTVFPHGLYGVFISSGATLGEECIIFHQTTIGSNTLAGTKRPGTPTLGRGVLLGAGAKVIGGVAVGANARIGANCVVVDDVPAGATVVLPQPRVIPADPDRAATEFRTWGAFEADAPD